MELVVVVQMLISNILDGKIMNANESVIVLRESVRIVVEVGITVSYFVPLLNPIVRVFSMKSN